jgi:aromatic ring-opening dioxygenase catalytic subunit (LigB family)
MSDFQHIRTPKMIEDNKFISKLAEISEKLMELLDLKTVLVIL